MARLAVLVCPQWPVVAVGCRADEAVAVLHANRVIARSSAAADAGVRVGQRRRDAQARCPTVRLAVHDASAEARAFHRVVDAVAEMVPRLELTVPGTLTFAARGPSRYFGGDAAMAALVVERVATVLGPSLAAIGRVGVGVADGRFAAGVAARLAARAGRPEVVPPGGSGALLADLPVGLLVDVGGLDRAVVELFHRLGLTRLGDVAALDESDLLARFGPVGAQARSMAAGADDRPLGAVEPPPGLAVEQAFEPPVEHLDAVVFAARALAEPLVEALAADGRVCTHLAVTVATEQGERSERVWSRPAGLGVAAVLERIRWQLDGWSRGLDDASAAGVVLLRLEPTVVRADEGAQAGLWGGRSQADDWAQRAVARLAGLVGDEQVVVAEWRGGRMPADQYRWVPASLGGASPVSSVSPVSPVSAPPWSGALPPPTPAVLYPEPVPVEVLDSAGRAVGVSARGLLSGEPARVQAEPIAAWAGPWPIDERWWDPRGHRRLARFQLLTASGRAYLATVERQRWWLVAEYG